MELTLDKIIISKDSVEALLESTLKSSKGTFSLAKAVRTFMEYFTDYVKTEQKLIDSLNIRELLDEKTNQIKANTEEEIERVNNYIKERNELLTVEVEIDFPIIEEDDIKSNILTGKQALILLDVGIVKESSDLPEE